MVDTGTVYRARTRTVSCLESRLDGRICVGPAGVGRIRDNFVSVIVLPNKNVPEFAYPHSKRHPDTIRTCTAPSTIFCMGLWPRIVPYGGHSYSGRLDCMTGPTLGLHADQKHTQVTSAVACYVLVPCIMRIMAALETVMERCKFLKGGGIDQNSVRCSGPIRLIRSTLHLVANSFIYRSNTVQVPFTFVQRLQNFRLPLWSSTNQ